MKVGPSSHKIDANCGRRERKRREREGMDVGLSALFGRCGGAALAGGVHCGFLPFLLARDRICLLTQAVTNTSAATPIV